MELILRGAAEFCGGGGCEGRNPRRRQKGGENFVSK